MRSCVWLDPNEAIKIRHQISDLLAVMTASPVMNIDETTSVSAIVNVAMEGPNAGFTLVDFLFQMLAAREVTLPMARAKRSWYGGVTVRIIYDLVAADLWSKNMCISDETLFKPHRRS